MGERAVLIKFGSCEHVSRFRDEGLLYMNTLSFFWNVEDEELRGDKCDCLVAMDRGTSGSVMPLNGEKLEVTNWTAVREPPNPEKINLFCMYALRQSTFPVDAKNFGFGDHAVIVTNVPEFIDRVRSYIIDNKLAASCNLLKYVDPYSGEMGPFRKLKNFAYQSEWRVVCKDGPGGVREERIGSIRDISIIMPSTEVNNWAETIGVFGTQ